MQHLYRLWRGVFNDCYFFGREAIEGVNEGVNLPVHMRDQALKQRVISGFGLSLLFAQLQQLSDQGHY